MRDQDIRKFAINIVKPHWLIVAVALQSPAIAAPGAGAETFKAPAAAERIAQGGSAGGSVGMQNKSLSGGDEESHSSHHAAKPSQRSAKPKAETGGSLAAYNGSWGGVSTGSCIANWSWTVQIADGVMTGSGTTGHVTRGGGVNGVMTVVGTAYVFQGHINSTAASGSWTTAAGCSGRWTAAKN